MDELMQWIRLQLDEDERVAKAAPPGPWIGTDAEDVGAWSVYDPEWLIASATVYTHNEPLGGKRGPGYIDAAATTAHIAAHDPARVLRDIEAKRRIVECHESWVAGNGDTICGRCGREHIEGRPGGHFPCQTLRLLALPYADRPGYLESWRP